MTCERYRQAIQELVDGTLGPIRKAELELHLDQCDACRAFADDLRRIHQLAGSLDELQPPDRVWLQVAGRLRQEGRVVAPAAVPRSRRSMTVLALAAALILAVGGSLVVLMRVNGTPEQAPASASGAPGNAPAADPVESVAAEFRLAEQHLQNAIGKLEAAAKTDDAIIDAQTASMLQKNLHVIDQAIAESRAALQQEPQSTRARDSLFELLRQKVVLLQDTIALMNEMRKGDSAAAAQILNTPKS